MPTELPSRKIAPPKATLDGNLVMLAAVLLMLVVSAALLLYPEGVPAIDAPAASQAV